MFWIETNYYHALLVTLGVGALMALTKSKKHFIDLTWDDEWKKGGRCVSG
jgi:hypothetical protein